MLTHERLELRDQLASEATREVGVDAKLDRLQTELLETGDLGLRERFVREVLERSTAPERQRLTEHERRRRRVDFDQRPPLGDHPLEAQRVDLLRAGLEEVAGRSGQQDRALGAPRSVGLERFAETGHVHPEGVVLVDPAVGAPQLVDDSIGGEDGVGGGQQESKERSLPECSQLDPLAVSHDLEVSEYQELHRLLPPVFEGWSESEPRPGNLGRP